MPRRALTAFVLAAASAAAQAQTAAPAPAPAASAPVAAGQEVQITGGRVADTDQRRQSTAAKIVIGREEIEKFGDATVGEVLRRLPGVSTPGAPGRGGPPRMRGLGGGYTQLLIDGQRVPPGFSLESLTPEQVERIEVLRAPTAETGARAIAGTINIITREGLRRRLNDLRMSLAVEDGELTPGLFWTHNDSRGPLTYNLSAGLFDNRRHSSSETVDESQDLATGATVLHQQTRQDSQERRQGLNLGGRLQWRLSENGDQLMLMPNLFTSKSTTARRFSLAQSVPPPPALPLYDLGTQNNENSFTNLRLGTQWRQRLTPATRLELDGGLGQWRASGQTERSEFRAGQALALRQAQDDSHSRERSANLALKLSSLLGGDEAQPGSEHNLVGGIEAESVRRVDERVSLQDGADLLTDFGSNLQASSLRLAAWAQDEWSLTPQWALHAGLRWEGITTRGDAGDGRRPRNESSVWTPLVHLLWKPDPKVRDQVRLSLTRSYRAPAVSQLIARPVINNRDPVNTLNKPGNPDSAGNPTLRPELARGIDLAFERYLEGGGLISANLFYREIKDLMRSVTELETVSWSPQSQRYVARPQNIGKASTTGIELEAKYRLDQLVAAAPRIELRHNLSLYRSRVQGIPGPDNRLDSQAPASANLGADYRLRGAPFTLGANVNWTPGYRTQQASDRATWASIKTIWDAFVLWTVNPETGLRLLANNLAPRDYASSTEFVTATTRDSSRTLNPSYANWQLRLELKL
ncbi:TonB-dependent receptor [Rubrivivax sp. A210]|nr:TonB-dependent receptor [Rubrivivax sp. A210]